MSSCTAQELVWVGTTISELDGDGEKSRIFFIHGSGDSGSEELHTPARNINTEMNDFNKTCDGHLVARKNPHSTDDPITSHWEGVGNSLRVYRTAELVSHCLYSNQSSSIYTAGEAKLLLLYLSTAGINSNLQSLMRKPQMVVCPAHEMRAVPLTGVPFTIVFTIVVARKPQKVGVCCLIRVNVALHSF